MWEFPGAVLWLPTAVNAFIAAEILQLAWERMRGGYNTAQGEIGPFMHIIAISAPIAVFLLVGWAVLAVLRANVPRSRESTQKRSVVVLAVLNVAAPFLLVFELGWLT
jgi:hypothetical protein